MAYFEDLTDYCYYRTESTTKHRNIGWLDAAHEYEKAEPSDELLELLWEFCSTSVTPDERYALL